MWIFMNNAMLSIVADRDTDDDLLVRARARGDINRVFPGTKELEVQGSDYAFRAWIPRWKVAEVIADQIETIDYTNFKDSINKSDQRRKRAYSSVWGTMLDYQEELEPSADSWYKTYRYRNRH